MIEYTKNYFNTNIDWQDLLENFNESVLLNEEVKFNPIAFYVSHSAIRIEKLKILYEKLNIKQAHLYLSLTNICKNFGPHADTMDVWFWQAKGKTKWQVLGNEYILSPGDLIYVPKGIEHNVIALTPRAGISMSKE
jgi:mannose-6-phosphate isomerase-like protein (cupin superfamily)